MDVQIKLTILFNYKLNKLVKNNVTIYGVLRWEVLNA